MAAEHLHRRYVTHRNFLRADANLKQRFRSADAEELASLEDCCAICREPMSSAKVLAARDTPRAPPRFFFLFSLFFRLGAAVG